jgi:hypothetical protein
MSIVQSLAPMEFMGPALAQVRHQTGQELANPFRISSGR